MGIVYLLTLLPEGRNPDPALVAEFNRTIDVEYDRIRDFLILHYHANQRGDGDLWRHCREMALPDTLTAKIERFRHRGHVATYRDGLFGAPSWQAVFVGQNLAPVGHDRLADRLPAADLSQRLASLRADIDAGVQSMPAHDDFIRGYCPADMLSA
jgi:tryptophan halogenase